MNDSVQSLLHHLFQTKLHGAQSRRQIIAESIPWIAKDYLLILCPQEVPWQFTLHNNNHNNKRISMSQSEYQPPGISIWSIRKIRHISARTQWPVKWIKYKQWQQKWIKLCSRERVGNTITTIKDELKRWLNLLYSVRQRDSFCFLLSFSLHLNYVLVVWGPDLL